MLGNKYSFIAYTAITAGTEGVHGTIDAGTKKGNFEGGQLIHNSIVKIGGAEDHSVTLGYTIFGN
jgi:hypothetical protein